MAMENFVFRSNRLLADRILKPATARRHFVHQQQANNENTSKYAVETSTRLAFSKSSLGLDRHLITPSLASIRQLPEVDSAWNDFPSPKVLDPLHRAVDVFKSFNKDGSEHIAVNAMITEVQHRNGMHEESIASLDELNHQVSNCDIANAPDDILIAKAKILWTMGRFEDCQELCESMISNYDDYQETFPTTQLHLASAMTGKALSQIASMGNLEQAFSVRDYFRIAIKFLERHPPSNALPLVAAYANCGAAEAIYNNFLEDTNDVSVPMDAALRTWFQGLQRLEKNGSISSADLQLTKGAQLLQASMQANLAWGVLNYEHDKKDRLKKASDYAKKALDAFGSESTPVDEGLRRVLSIVAACYHQAGSAVTAEGLFQSATSRSQLPPGPLSLLELQDAFRGYSDLCTEWEKRERDAEQLKKKAMEIDNQLPEAWRGKSGIHSSLWFWTPADFQ